MQVIHCLKSVCIRTYSGSYFPAFYLNTERCGVSLRIQSQVMENTDQKNSEYKHFLGSDTKENTFLELNTEVPVTLANSFLRKSFKRTKTIDFENAKT